jgi:glycosyltransferase involved in cell wall biosynthesis
MGRYVGDALRSALAQTYTDIEVIVCDNASSDDTSAILATFSDPRLQIFRNPENLGATANFNLVVERSAGTWIKFLEADDMLAPTCVEEMIDAAGVSPKVGIVSVGRVLIDGAGNVVGADVRPQSALVSGSVVRRRTSRAGNEIGTPTDVMARRSILVESGLFDVEFGGYINDYDLWIRCVERCDVMFLARPLAIVRRHEGQIGAVGSRSNRDIDVNFLMVRKRWSDARFPTWRWRQKMSLMLRYVETYFLRGVRHCIRRPPTVTVSRLDFLWKLWNNTGPVLLPIGIIYTLLRAPFRAWGAGRGRLERRRTARATRQ